MLDQLAINYNYDGTGYDYVNDIQHIYDVGFRHIRLLMSQYDATSQVNLWKTIAQYALTIPFDEITFGVSSNPTTITSGNIATFTTAVQAIALWCQQQGDARLTLCTGNEEMNHHDGSISDTAVRAAMYSNYVTCTGIYTLGKRTYSMANNEMFLFFNDGQWPGAVGSDYVSANLYSTPTGQTSGSYYAQNIDNAQFWFGTGVVLTEFGPDPSGYTATVWKHRSFYEEQFLQNLDTAMEKSVPRVYIYNFQDSLFGCLSPNRVYRPWWYSLRGVRKPL